MNTNSVGERGRRRKGRRREIEKWKEEDQKPNKLSWG